jgi:SH3-like domain-containing protein
MTAGSCRRLAALALMLLVQAAVAEAADAPAGVVTGEESGQPLPRYVSIKAADSNVRRGPSIQHRVDWVYNRPNLPVQVVAEHGHWRRIRDAEGAGGWIHHALLTGLRHVLLVEDATLWARPGAEAVAHNRVTARAEAGAIARLGDCNPGWCEIRADGARGWAPKTALWGVAPDEIRD